MGSEVRATGKAYLRATGEWVPLHCISPLEGYVMKLKPKVSFRRGPKVVGGIVKGGCQITVNWHVGVGSDLKLPISDPPSWLKFEG